MYGHDPTYSPYQRTNSYSGRHYRFRHQPSLCTTTATTSTGSCTLSSTCTGTTRPQRPLSYSPTSLSAFTIQCSIPCISMLCVGLYQTVTSTTDRGLTNSCVTFKCQASPASSPRAHRPPLTNWTLCLALPSQGPIHSSHFNRTRLHSYHGR